MNYPWNFGNGITSNQRVDSVFYDTSGTYLVSLYVSDTLGFADTLQQYIVVPNCSITAQAKLANVDQQNEFATNLEVNTIISSSQNVEIFPNPFTDIITIKCFSKNYNLLSLYDISGRLIIKIPITMEQQIVDLQSLARGTYIIKFHESSTPNYFKLVKK